MTAGLFAPDAFSSLRHHGPFMLEMKIFSRTCMPLDRLVPDMIDVANFEPFD